MSLLYTRDLRNPKFRYQDSVLRTNESTIYSNHSGTPSNKNQSKLKQAISNPVFSTPYSQAFYDEKIVKKSLTYLPLEGLQLATKMISPVKNIDPKPYLFQTPQHSLRKDPQRRSTDPPDISLRNLRLSSKRNEKIIGMIDSYYGVKREPIRHQKTVNPNLTNLPSQSMDHEKFKNYLSYLHQNVSELSKEQFQKKLRAKHYKKTESYNLEEEDQLLSDHVLFLPPVYSNKSESRMIEPAAMKKYSNQSRGNTSRLESTLEGRSSEQPNSESNSSKHELGKSKNSSRQPTLNNELNSSPDRITTSSRKEIKKIESETELDNRKESDTFKKYSDLFNKLAENMRYLYLILNHEKKIVAAVEELSHRNKKILDLVTAKGHKIQDYDPEKLLHRFSKIEEVTHPSTFHERVEKIRAGKIIMDTKTIQLLYLFSERLEEHVILKKRESLKGLEEKLIEGEENLLRFREKKLIKFKKDKSQKSLKEAQRILHEKPNIDPIFFFKSDPSTMIKSYSLNDDLKFVKKMNIEEAKFIGEVFSNWYDKTIEFQMGNE
jgi:hypothetical protein